MSDDPNTPDIPFSPNDWVIDRNNPGQPGQYTRHWRKTGPHVMVQLSYPGGGASYRPLACLEKNDTGFHMSLTRGTKK